MKDLEEIILKTLSFYRPFTIAQILLEMKADDVSRLADYTMSDLRKQLHLLVKGGKLKELKLENGEVCWIRIVTRKRHWPNPFSFIQ